MLRTSIEVAEQKRIERQIDDSIAMGWERQSL